MHPRTASNADPSSSHHEGARSPRESVGRPQELGRLRDREPELHRGSSGSASRALRPQGFVPSSVEDEEDRGKGAAGERNLEE